ncbi:protein-tyrosine-phosphatase [Emticicia aquatilis]|uniref:Protein-tyrosine-phosphatase n=1 Tax=Emticicia aquatilis TaxID=1537369 RepID=A0A916Z193_9BACT|nr:protein tyrosine phosphatase [Emticicia aquatilis]GGD71032.1 protein-tyrosine-phosphatase [Emticicia aquatilis]
MNLLFVCSRNQWRSPTAEEIFKNNQEHQAKSAGTEPSARIKITEKLINWADIIFVMEKKHKERIKQRFATVVDEKELIVLDIPDEYQFMDEELVDLIKLSVSPYL